MTSLTTFAGLAPLLFEKSVQAKFLIPMAVSLAFGVLFATFITLVLVPCGYFILEDAKDGLARVVGRGRERERAGEAEAVAAERPG
jgi:predicted RND superfamily exporter protein